jgi:hypothetical protein
VNQPAHPADPHFQYLPPVSSAADPACTFQQLFSKCQLDLANYELH